MAVKFLSSYFIPCRDP